MSSVSTGCVAQMFSVSSVLQACCGNHREGQQWPSVCMPVAKPQELSVHLSLLACSRNHRNPLFTSVCWPVTLTETTGTICSPQFAGLFQKSQEPSVHLSLLACYRNHGALCLPACCRRNRNHLFTSVCWPFTEATGPSVHLCLLACYRSHWALCSPLFAGLLQKPQGPLFTSVCWPVAETTGEGGSGQQLKEHLVDELDYMLVPAEAWNKLVAWYTLMPGQVCSRQRNGCCLCG